MICLGLTRSSWDKTAKIWNRYTGVCEVTLSGHSRGVSNAVFSADDSLVLTTAEEAAKIWYSATGECTLTLPFRNLGGYLQKSAAFSPDESSVLACCTDEVSIWDSTTGVCKQTLTGRVLENHFSSAMYSADGALIVTASKDPATAPQIWDSATGECVLTLSGHYDVVCFAIFFLCMSHELLGAAFVLVRTL